MHPRCAAKFLIALILLLIFIAQVCYITIQASNWQWFCKVGKDDQNEPSAATAFTPQSGTLQLHSAAAGYYSNCSNGCKNKVIIQQVQSLSSFFKTNYTSEKFSIIVPTFKRNYCVYTVLRHYCKMKYVATIIVLWNNLGEEIPRYLKKIKCRSTLKYIKMKENRMTTRYILLPEIQTEAVLALDDDRIVTEESLMFAFSIWKKFRHKIVGFCSRTYDFDSDGKFIYQQEKRYPYSLILPNAAFIHRKYLDMFTYTLPRNLYHFIDVNMNVDDIAMNAMIADFLKNKNEPQCAGLLVNGNMTGCKVTGSEFTGLWRRENHNQVRTEFLNLINQTYRYMPLTECDIAITHLADTH